MPINFPDAPVAGQSFTVGTRTWTYDGSEWVLLSSSISPAPDYNTLFMFGGM